MKKILLLTVISLLIVNTAFAEKMVVTSKKLSIRQITDTDGYLLRVLPTGYMIDTLDGTEVMAGGDEWVKVRDNDGLEGYVRKMYLSSVDSKNNITQVLINKIEAVGSSKKTQDKVLKQNNIESNIVMVSGEGLHRVEISLKDLNRITCSGSMSDPVYSKDKEVEIVRGGKKDLFVKISPVKITQGGMTEVRYNTFPRELYVECDSIVYNLSLLPKEDKPSQTIVFKTPYADSKKAMSYEQSTAYETMVSDIFKNVYQEMIPEGYAVKKGSLKYEFQEMDMRLRYVYTGHDYVVEDWEVKSKVPHTVELEENMFVPVLKNPRAISLTVPRLSANEKGRLLVIRAASANR